MFFASLLHQSPHGVCCLIGLECLNSPSWFLDWTFSQPKHNLKNLRVGWKHLFSLLRLKCCNACFRERHEMERSSFTLFDLLGIFVEPWLESTAKGWSYGARVFRVCGVAVWCHVESLVSSIEIMQGSGADRGCIQTWWPSTPPLVPAQKAVHGWNQLSCSVTWTQTMNSE